MNFMPLQFQLKMIVIACERQNFAMNAKTSATDDHLADYLLYSAKTIGVVGAVEVQYFHDDLFISIYALIDRPPPSFARTHPR